jgi:type II secretory pathway component GspD/PulD (secretin)
VSTNEVNSPVTITLRDVPLDDALTSILSIGGYTWTVHRGIIHVTSASAVSSLAPETQGRLMRVFPLHYALASDIEPVVRGLLSPVGKTFFTASSPADNRKTQESLVVEDLPPYLDRVAQYLAQADVTPRQVLIEAHVLQIDLKDENRHGVNLSYLSELAGKTIQFEFRGNANPMASQAALLTFEGADLQALIEMLRTTTDSKTLASPRVLVVNGQEARIQVGAQLGFRVTTTTQTSTLESVNFLDVGVVLRVTPRIDPAGNVLMHVKPEVSSGQVNATTGLPEEETTEVETDIMLRNGQGVVIGGLIQENANDVQNKLPILGDLPLIGRLFQHRTNDKTRSEIIIALVPRVVPFEPHFDAQNEADYYRATSPILDCQIHRLPRDDGYWLYDACNNPFRPLHCIRRLPPIGGSFGGPIGGPIYREVLPPDAVIQPSPAPTAPLPSP